MAKQGTLLVVDDNRNILTSLQYLLEEYFQQVITLNSPVTIPSLLQREAIDVVLLDMNFSSGINSGNEGLYWLREIKRLRPQIQVVLFTAYADINLAVTGLKDGATDFIVKPWDNAKLVQTLQEAYAKARGNEKKGKQASQPTEKSSMYWGNSSVIRPLRLLVEKVSTTRCQYPDYRRKRYGKRYAGTRNSPAVSPPQRSDGGRRYGSHYRITV